MNSKQISSLQLLLENYLKNKYSDSNLSKFKSLDTISYLKAFENILEDTDDLFSANFILPDGKLKEFKVDLSDFVIPEIYQINFNLTKENIFNMLNLKHDTIKYFGFDLDKLLDLGCIRIGNNKIDKEVYLHMNLTKKPSKPLIDIFENCLISYDTVLIEWFNLSVEKFARYSLKNGDSIKSIIKDINILLKEGIK